MAIEHLNRLEEKIGWGLNFNIDITWTQDKVKVTDLKKLSKRQFLELLKKLMARHTFCSDKIINVKGIHRVLWKL